MDILVLITEALFLVAALSLDAFAASFAYGTNRIKIPFRSVIIISLICSAMLGIALLAGRLLQNIVPEKLTVGICFTILFLLSLTKFFDFFIKMWIRKSKDASPKVDFHFLNFHFLLQLMCDATQADVDDSKVLSSKEAVALAVALSFDGLAAGLGAGMAGGSLPLVLLFSFLLSLVSVVAGCFIGNKIAGRTELNLTWISGVILLILAVLKLSPVAV